VKKMADPESPMDRLDEALRALAARPPAVTPAAAARGIAARIEGLGRRAPRLRPAWAWTAATVLVAGGIAVLLRVGQPPPAGSDPVVGAREPAGAGLSLAGTLADGEVLIWLDAETPLYMSFAPPARARDDGGGS
jgi:hypothetical protein